MTTLRGANQLRKVAERLESGEHIKVTIRTLIGWFGYQRRRVETVVPQIRSVLEELGLATVPELPAWGHSLDDAIEFRKEPSDAIIRRWAARIVDQPGKRRHAAQIEKFEAALTSAEHTIVVRGGAAAVCGLTTPLPDHLWDALITCVAQALLDGLPTEPGE